MHHLTHINNLKLILKEGLKSRNFNNQDFVDTADSEMIEERKSIYGKDLNEYVPFHLNFLQINHMIGYNYVVLRNNGMTNMVYLILDYPFTEKKILCYLHHPASRYAIEYSDLKTFISELFKTYNELKNKNGNKLNFKDHQTQQFLKSEILIYKKVSIDKIKEIVVFSKDVEKQIVDLLRELNITHIKTIVNINFFRR